MANTYSRINLQVVFSVKNRLCLLDKSWRGELFAYMSGIINERGNYSLAVNGVSDHVHLFFDYKGKELISDLVREVKKASNNYIKAKGWLKSKFEWQAGYGVFSHGYREKSIIINYVLNQENHHAKKSFKKEYLQLLNAFEVEFKDQYLFDFFEDL